MASAKQRLPENLEVLEELMDLKMREMRLKAVRGYDGLLRVSIGLDGADWYIGEGKSFAVALDRALKEWFKDYPEDRPDC